MQFSNHNVSQFLTRASCGTAIVIALPALAVGLHSFEILILVATAVVIAIFFSSQPRIRAIDFRLMAAWSGLFLMVVINTEWTRNWASWAPDLSTWILAALLLSCRAFLLPAAAERLVAAASLLTLMIVSVQLAPITGVGPIELQTFILKVNAPLLTVPNDLLIPVIFWPAILSPLRNRQNIRAIASLSCWATLIVFAWSLGSLLCLLVLGAQALILILTRLTGLRVTLAVVLAFLTVAVLFGTDLLATGSAQSRIGLWQDAFDQAKSSWLTGTGFADFSASTAPASATHPGLSISWAHNMFLETWAALGLPALLFLIWLIAELGCRLHRTRNDLKVLSPARVAAISALLISACAELTLQRPGVVLLIGYLMIWFWQSANQGRSPGREDRR